MMMSCRREITFQPSLSARNAGEKVLPICQKLTGTPIRLEISQRLLSLYRTASDRLMRQAAYVRTLTFSALITLFRPW